MIDSLFASFQFMNIGSTAAMMLAVDEVLAGFTQNPTTSYQIFLSFVIKP